MNQESCPQVCEKRRMLFIYWQRLGKSSWWSEEHIRICVLYWLKCDCMEFKEAKINGVIFFRSTRVYRSAETACEVVWLRWILKDLELEHNCNEQESSFPLHSGFDQQRRNYHGIYQHQWSAGRYSSYGNDFGEINWKNSKTSWKLQIKKAS